MLKQKKQMRRLGQAGFTLVEIMLVMAVAAVMTSLKMQDEKLEMEQLKARKLGATELFVYNLGVQKYVSSISGTRPAPGDYPKVYTGVDWLKNTACPSGTGTASSDFVPCPFLSNSGGRTTLGAMTFETTIDYDAATGYTARTVLSQMAGTAAGESNSGTLGLAALVASGAFIGSDASATAGGSGGSIIYCPDINPMPAGMAAICDTPTTQERDQIVMIVNTNGANDNWLRVDHGNVMSHAIEFNETAGAVPATDADLALSHPTMRQIRNVAQIYNVAPSAGGGTQNLIIGNNTGEDIESNPATYLTLIENAVIIDADQEIVGQLIVQNGITVNTGGVTTQSGDFTALTGGLTVDRDIVSANGNANINGWITAGGDITSTNGDIEATTGVVRATRFEDTDAAGFNVDPSGNSRLTNVEARNLTALNDASNGARRLSLNANRLEFNHATSPGSAVTLEGRVRADSLQVLKNGRYYTLDSLLPNLTFIGAYKVSRGDGGGSGAVWGGSINAACGGSSRVRVYVTPLRDSLEPRAVGGVHGANRQYGSVGRFVTYSGGYYRYYVRPMYDNDGEGTYDYWATAILEFYCYR